MRDKYVEIRDYRGKRVDGKGWVKGWYVQNLHSEKHFIVNFIKSKDKKPNWCGINQPYDCNDFEVIPESVGQYIGENDDNDNRIYENDIVKASIYCDEDPKILEVYFEDGAFWIDYKDDDSDRCLVATFVGTIEIVGNLTDNPELLEEKP